MNGNGNDYKIYEACEAWFSLEVRKSALAIGVLNFDVGLSLLLHMAYLYSFSSEGRCGLGSPLISKTDLGSVTIVRSIVYLTASIFLLNRMLMKRACATFKIR
jgi:hypothetical protein